MQLGGGGWASLLIRDLQTGRGVGCYTDIPGHFRFSPVRWHWMAGTQMGNGYWKQPQPRELSVFQSLSLEELEAAFALV